MSAVTAAAPTERTSRVQSRMRAMWGPLKSAFRKVDPRVQWHNPVLFLVWCGSVLTTIIGISEFWTGPADSGGLRLPAGFTWVIAVNLWLTVIAANLAEALAEDQGRFQAARLRSTREGSTAHRVGRYDPRADADASDAVTTDVSSIALRPGDIVVASAGDIIPADGEVIWGIASVDESAITGESAPVIREAGGDRSGVTGGTRVLSDRIVVRVTVPHGKTAVDKMIGLAEGAHRQKAPHELALTALLASFSVSFIVIALTVNAIVSPFALPVSVPVWAAVVVCLIPAEIAALLSVTGVASMSRLVQNNVLADSAHALETAGDITTVVLDKTGTITQGDRRATHAEPLHGVSRDELLRAAVASSLRDPTPEGVSAIALARESGIDIGALEERGRSGRTVLFSAQTRLSGIDLPNGSSARKGAESAILAWLKHVGTQPSRAVVDELKRATSTIARAGGTPIVVAAKLADEPGRILGVIHFKDVVKPAVVARISQLHALGVRTVMITGDNPLTAKSIAAEAGVDAFVGDATPEDKLALVKREQADGHFVAMTGDGTNDAPALAQADVGVAMNSATAAAKEAANMIVLDDDPTKLVEIVETGRRQRATRGALTTFNIANDIIRYFAIFPPLFVAQFPGLDKLNILRLHSPASAILSTVIYSVAVIFILIRLALAGVPYRLVDLGRALNLNLLYYGVGGVIFAAVWIKLIDLVVSLIPGY
ncbi:MAG: potassium-transporting ATPase subunit KdpB [Actinomycetia bacterium]|nr:potassium-transporting ATPase subunit KdpB [Actinomycetes bacterium]